MTSWAQGALLGVDTETTGFGADARIVTAAVIHVRPDRSHDTVLWVIDPGCEVPAEAAAVHGWTRDRVLAEVGGEGMALRVGDGQRLQVHADGALFEIAGLLARAMQAEVPVVAANAVFDLTIIEAELARYGIDPLSSMPSGIRGVVDPMVIEKQWDPFRKNCYKSPGCRPDEERHECSGCRGGKFKCGGCGVRDRKLASLCKHYQVPLEQAHDAAADTMGALRLAVRLAHLWPEVARWKLPTLHAHQVTWKREQADSLRDFWRKKGDERWREVDGSWPLRPVAEAVA